MPTQPPNRGSLPTRDNLHIKDYAFIDKDKIKQALWLHFLC